MFKENVSGFFCVIIGKKKKREREWLTVTYASLCVLNPRWTSLITRTLPLRVSPSSSGWLSSSRAALSTSDLLLSVSTEMCQFPKTWPTFIHTHTHAHLRHAAGEASYIASYIRQGKKSIFSQQSVFISSSCQCKLPVVEVPWSFFLIIINGMFFLFIQLSIITVSFFRLACCVFPSYFLIRAENNMTHLCRGKCILSACVGICVFASSSVGGLELVFASVVSLLSPALQ